MRVMICMLTATYAESEISTPICAICEPIGPMENGITYSVRPRMQPSNRRSSVWRISRGSIQLFVGPASSLSWLQMKVRSSMRATSLGCDRARYEFGCSFSFRRMNVPALSSSAHNRSYSAREPSHQWMRSGLERRATSDTHCRTARGRTHAGAIQASRDLSHLARNQAQTRSLRPVLRKDHDRAHEEEEVAICRYRSGRKSRREGRLR